MRVLTLTFLPEHPAQMPVLTKNVNVQGREACPFQNGPQVLPVPKGQGGHMHFILQPQSCSPPRGSYLGRDFFTTDSTSAAPFTSATSTSSGTATL